MQPHSIETIGDVYLVHVHRAMLGVRVPYPVEQTFQGATELHRRRRCEGNGVVIDSVEGQVVDEPRSSVPLRDGAKWGDPHPRYILNQFPRKYDPKGFGVKLRHLFTDELFCFDGRSVWPAGEPLLKFVGTPCLG